MKLIYILPCLFYRILSQGWPKSTRTEILQAPITIGEGETFDGFEKNNNQWVSYERGVKGLRDCRNIEGGQKIHALF